MTAPSSRTPASTRLPGEAGRMLFLAAVAAWLLHPFATSRQIGAGDALWYANMLADFVLQWRAGIFPVFAGQTEFAFNGAVYPLRVAPLYQHLGGLLDLLTGRQLGWFALQHLTVIVMGVAGIFSCYLTLCALRPERRGTAAVLAILYLSCPGVLGTLYTQDLYMTWMTVPFVPLAFYGPVRAFQRDDFIAQAWWAAALAALWLAHSPIALWVTICTGLLQLIRLLLVQRNRAAWLRAVGGGLLFAVLGHYPFVSIATLGSPGTTSAVTGGLENAERISNVVREVFPGVLLPLSRHAAALSDLQLGYGFWLVLLSAFLALAFIRDWALRGLVLCCALLLGLLLPVPGNDWLWAHLPEQIKRITFYWPMHRFYLLLAALLAVAGQLGLAAWSARNRRLAQISSLVLGAACAWSLWETRQFIGAASDRTSSAETSARRQRSENLLLMNHAYGLFPALPAYFSNGTMDPLREVRLLDQDSMKPREKVNPLEPLQPLRGTIDDNPGVLKLEPTFRLESGKRYELSFEFKSRVYTGILQLAGREFFREYALPASGQPLAFGSAPGCSRSIPVWTTLAEGDELQLRFIPTASGETPAHYADFGRYRWREIASGAQPVNVTSLVPFRAMIHATAPMWLETPRMFQPGYIARVNEQEAEVRPSPEGLVMFLVPAGDHEVVLHYEGPPALDMAYWATLTIWIILIGAAAVGLGRSRVRAALELAASLRRPAKDASDNPLL